MPRQCTQLEDKVFKKYFLDFESVKGIRLALTTSLLYACPDCGYHLKKIKMYDNVKCKRFNRWKHYNYTLYYCNVCGEITEVDTTDYGM